jgi:hypothetical protein
MEVTKILSEFAINPSFNFMTANLAESIIKKFIDTIGITIAGADSPASKIIRESVMNDGCIGGASIIGTSERNSIIHAGFINGVSAHALEYDDLTPDITHLSSSLVPGCLAVSESLDSTGKQLVESFAIGFEIAGRISLGMKSLAMLDRGFHTPGMIGGLGVTIASSRLMGLDSMAMRMAIGLMSSSGVGIRKNVGSAGKAFHIGNGVRAGLQASTLARYGYEVDPDAIEGINEGHGHQRFGLLESYAGNGNYNLSKIIEGLGGEFILTQIPTMVRMHPCSTVICVAIDGIIELTNKYNLQDSDVDTIDVFCHPRLLMIAPYSEPVDSYRAKFCPAYVIAAALIEKEIGLAQFKNESLNNQRILALMKRIKMIARNDIKEDHGWCNGRDNWCSVTLKIKKNDGVVISEHFSQAKGWPVRPVSWDDLRMKFEECTEGVLSKIQIQTSISMIRDLPELKSTRELIAQFVTKNNK